MNENNIVPDILDLDMALLNDDINVVLKLKEKYNYKPSIMTLLIANISASKKIILGKIFYPELVTVNYNENHEYFPENDKIKIKTKKIKKESNDDNFINLTD